MQSSAKNRPQNSNHWAGPAVLWLLLFSCGPLSPPEKPKDRLVEQMLPKGGTYVLVVANAGSATPPFSEKNIRLEGKNARQKPRSSALPADLPPAFFGGGAPQITYAQMPTLDDLPLEARSSYIEEPQYSHVKAPSYALGEALEFNVQVARNGSYGQMYKNRSFSLRKKETNSPWTIHYWVDDSSWDAGNTSTRDDKVGSADIEKIAKKFSAKDQILDTHIDIYGQPWGSHNFNNAIPGDTRNLHILIYDINLNGSRGTTRGYFWSRDNTTDKKNSNHKLIITVDAPSLSRDKNMTYGVLIHELNHMTVFYQKRMKRASASPETWLSEMMAQMASDLISEKLFRSQKQPFTKMIAAHLLAPWESLTNWGNKLEDYYSVSHFAAFLLRSQYSGYGRDFIKLAQHIQNNAYTDYRAITHATRQLKSRDSWGQILLSYATTALKGHTTTERTSFMGKPFQLEPIKPFELITASRGPKKGNFIGIPMFDITKNSRRMPYFFSSGRPSRYENPSRANQIQAPEPGGFIYVYLGKYKRNVSVRVTLPPGLEYEIVRL